MTYHADASEEEAGPERDGGDASREQADAPEGVVAQDGQGEQDAQGEEEDGSLANMGAR